MVKEVFKLAQGFALTGSIGAGKSTVVESLRARGWTALESDRLAHELVRPGEPAHREIRDAFGEEVMGPEGELDRAKLADVVFQDEEKRRVLEGILHPRIRARWLEEAEKAESQGKRVVVEVPLLFETGAEKHFERVVVVACSEKTQRSRLRARGWNDGEIDRRLGAQLPQQEKIDRADHMIWNEFLIKDMEEQLRNILDRLPKE
jgi:dephospho-CoA kinase